jgi:hypothetical protein
LAATKVLKTRGEMKLKNNMISTLQLGLKVPIRRLSYRTYAGRQSSLYVGNVRLRAEMVAHALSFSFHCSLGARLLIGLEAATASQIWSKASLTRKAPFHHSIYHFTT